MNNYAKIIEVVAFLLALGSGMAFNLHHHIWGIWLGVVAGCIALIGLGVWLTFDDVQNGAPKSDLQIPPITVTLPPENDSPPLVQEPEQSTTPDPVTNPPPTPVIPPSAPTAVNGDQITITAPDNKGTVIGKQTMNFAPPERTLSDNQRTAFLAFVNNAPKAGNISITFANSGDEVSAYGWAIQKLLVDAGFKPIDLKIPYAPLTDLPAGLTIAIKDPSNLPANAEQIFEGFNRMNVKFVRAKDPAMQDNIVAIYVGKMPPN